MLVYNCFVDVQIGTEISQILIFESSLWDIIVTVYEIIKNN